jgi:hypothetical protein
MQHMDTVFQKFLRWFLSYKTIKKKSLIYLNNAPLQTEDFIFQNTLKAIFQQQQGGQND